MAMGNWKTRKTRKSAHGKQESGKKKGLCPPAWARHCAKSARAYKHPRYDEWCAKCTGEKVKWTKQGA